MKWMVLAVALTACGVDDRDNLNVIGCKGLPSTCNNGKQDVAEDLKKTVGWVEYKLGINVKYDVVFSEQDGLDGKGDFGTKLGICYSISSVPLMIAINKYMWEQMTVGGRRQLILHEVGHCSYNLDHTDTYDEVMSPSMNPYGRIHTYKDSQTNFIQQYERYGR